MSSSSLYDPEEDDDASNSDIDTNQHRPTRATSSRRRYSAAYRVRKRKRGTREQALAQLVPSLPRLSIDAYSALLAEESTENDDAPQPVPAPVSGPAEGETWHSTQHGVVTWTSREKDILHQWLERKGANGIREIARAVGTKSELEVQEYLRLLHRGLERQHLRDRHSRTVILGEVPAAAEISADCCRALDEYATLLALEEQKAEDVAGRLKHQELWIVDSHTAEAVEERLETMPENEESDDRNRDLDPDDPSSSVLHTGRLLNMRLWVRLAERFFMNAGGARLDENWVNVAYADETPSVTADAFADLYALTVSVTRRLVHSALFFAMARLRNMRETGNPKAQVVRTRDVRAALDVLDMPRNSSEYWVGLARRCSLDVADIRNRAGWKPVPLSHDEVEGILRGEVQFDMEPGTRSASRQRRRSQTGEETDGEDAVEDYSENEPESEPAAEAASVLSSPIELSDDEEAPQDLVEKHAEQLDEYASRREERYLWEIMGAPASEFVDDPEIKHEDDSESKLQRPIGERKTKEDLVSWRDRTLYRSEWEEYGHEVFDLYEESQSRRKRRRVEVPETATDPIDESVSPSPEDPPQAAPVSTEDERTDAPYEDMDIDHPEPEPPSNTHPEHNSSESSAASAVDSEESNRSTLQPKQLSRVRKTGNDNNEEPSSSSQDDLLPPNRANRVLRRQR